MKVSRISVTCPHCLQTFDRKPTKPEMVFGSSQGLTVKQLLYIYSSRCNGCDKKFKDIDEATIDHIQPKSKGGKNGLHNYQLLCSPCNRRKGNHWVDDKELHLFKMSDFVKKDFLNSQEGGIT